MLKDVFIYVNKSWLLPWVQFLVYFDILFSVGLCSCHYIDYWPTYQTFKHTHTHTPLTWGEVRRVSIIKHWLSFWIRLKRNVPWFGFFFLFVPHCPSNAAALMHFLPHIGRKKQTVASLVKLNRGILVSLRSILSLWRFIIVHFYLERCFKSPISGSGCLLNQFLFFEWWNLYLVSIISSDCTLKIPTKGNQTLFFLFFTNMLHPSSLLNHDSVFGSTFPAAALCVIRSEWWWWWWWERYSSKNDVTLLLLYQQNLLLLFFFFFRGLNTCCTRRRAEEEEEEEGDPDNGLHGTNPLSFSRFTGFLTDQIVRTQRWDDTTRCIFELKTQLQYKTVRKRQKKIVKRAFCVHAQQHTGGIAFLGFL